MKHIINMTIEVEVPTTGINKNRNVEFYLDWYKGFIDQGRDVTVTEIKEVKED